MKIGIKKVKGNIIDMIERGEITATAHGCNCFHTMGSGIAKTFNEYTGGKLLEADKQTVYGDINNLGNYTSIDFNGVEFFNIYSQYVYAGQFKEDQQCLVYVNWGAVYHALKNIVGALSGKDNSVLALPYIGCGLAGGEETSLIAILDEISECEELFEGGSLTILLVEFKP